MTFQFPEFPDPIAIDGQHSWTAVLDSFNQRTDDLYYRLTLHHRNQPVACFMAQAACWTSLDGEELVSDVREQLHAVASTGATNTSYQGALFDGRTENAG